MKRIQYGQLLILFFIACIIILPLTACDEEEVTRAYTRVETFQVNGITVNGATFLAEIIEGSDKEIDQIGFVWGKTSSLQVELSEFIFINKQDINGKKFSFDVRSTLEENVTYYVRAFARQGELTVYGQIQSFNSLGSEGPTVNYIEPSSGTLGDTVLIYGQSFSNRDGSNQVKLGDIFIPPFFSSDSLLKVVIPQSFNQEVSQLTVSIVGNNSSDDIDFTLTSPVISGFTPEAATDLNEVTIIGNNFAWNKTFNIVKFNDQVATVLEANKKELVVQVPAGVTTAMPVVTVTVAGKVGTSNNIYSMLPPVITDFNPKSGICGDLVTITGENFGTIASSNNLFFDGLPIPITSFSANTLTFLIPSNLVNNQGHISIKTAEQTVLSVDDLTINSPTIEDFNPKTGNESTVITITGTNLGDNQTVPVVKFGNSIGQIIGRTNSSIQVRVPSGLSSNQLSIKIEIGCYTISTLATFNLLPPEIDDFNPKQAFCGEEITISGSNFSGSLSSNIVTFGSVPTTIISALESEIVVLVPSQLSDSPVQINVSTAGQNTNSQQLFTRSFNGPVNLVPTDGLVSHYPFNGNAVDESINNNDGIVNGATLTADRNNCANSAYSFDGINDYINLGRSSLFNLANYEEFTFSIWVKPNSLSSFNVIFSKYISASNNRSYTFRYSPTNQMSLMLFQNGGNSNNQSLDVTVDNEWHHITWVYTSLDKLAKVYVDGNFAGSRNFPYAIYSGSSALALIGATNASSSGQTFDGNFSGVLDEFRLYDRALTSEEIMSIYIGEDCISCN